MSRFGYSKANVHYKEEARSSTGSGLWVVMALSIDQSTIQMDCLIRWPLLARRLPCLRAGLSVNWPHFHCTSSDSPSSIDPNCDSMVAFGQCITAARL
jgi:hypothetical protein